MKLAVKLAMNALLKNVPRIAFPTEVERELTPPANRRPPWNDDPPSTSKAPTVVKSAVSVPGPAVFLRSAV
jgi:hypothetical protein